ncbi:hypothetical protein MNV49_006634 [Pseudohyphozyma bogoriensis]|nr:hypothetical protein MNV49_006634 [Pseudohyphozyma bogoriensis]
MTIPAAPSVKFELSPSSAPTPTNRARHGRLSFTSAGSTKVLETPMLMTNSQRGAVPHLTRDIVARLPIEAGMISLSLEHFLDQRPPPFLAAPFSLHRYMGFHQSSSQNQQLLALGLRDSADPVPMVSFNHDESVSANTGTGAIKVTPAEYLAWTLPRPPDLLFSFADDPLGGDLSKKRLRKSITRSLAWIEEIALGAKGHVAVFAPLVGGSSPAGRELFVKLLSAETEVVDAISGWTLDVATALGPSTQPDPLAIPSLFNTSLSPLSPSKPRTVLSAAGPHDVLRLVRDVGIDCFVDEWSSRCSTDGCALDFDFPVDPNRSREAKKDVTTGKTDVGYSLFDTKHVGSFLPLSTSPLGQPSGPHPFGSEPPTRAYVHHLLQTHELTAHVILAIHNTLVMHNFFASIRTLLASSTSDVFEKEVEKFFEAYAECTPFSGGNYECMEEAKVELDRIDELRGKGSLAEKRKADRLEETAARLEEEVDKKDL